MATLEETIVRSTQEGCNAKIYEVITQTERENAIKKGEPSKIDVFCADVERNLLNLGWKRCDPDWEEAQIARHFKDYHPRKFYSLGNRLAVLFTELDRDGDYYNDVNQTCAIVAHLWIPSTFEYDLQLQEVNGNRYTIYSDWFDLQEVNEVLFKHGWVVTEPTKEIASAYLGIEEVVFYEKGNFFAVTGFEYGETVVFIRNKDYRTMKL